MLVLPPSVTLSNAPDALALLNHALANEPQAATVIVEAGGLQHFDSAVLALLLECRRGAHASGRRFSVRGITAPLTQLTRLYGVEDLLLHSDSLAVAAAG